MTGVVAAVGAGLPVALTVPGAGGADLSVVAAAATCIPDAAFLALFVAAAVIDARSRRFPNALAAVMAVFAAACATAVPGRVPAWGVLGANVAVAVAGTGALLAFELLWRRVRGSAGIGMGDVKLLLCLLLADPARGAVTFAGGLLLLAAGCLVLRRRDLPLIPFAFPVWAASLAVAPFA